MHTWDLTGILSAYGAWHGVAESCLEDFNEECLQDALAMRLDALGLTSPQEWVQFARQAPEELSSLHAACFNSTSAFFRDPWSFCALERQILPGLISRGTLRIWSAGCAEGQEALSLAILLEELERARPGSGRSTVIASDTAATSLSLSFPRVYPENQLNNLTLGRLKQWFVPQTTGFSPIQGLLARVHYFRHDLLDAHSFSPPEAVFGGYDLICCANVLIYYTASAQVRVLENLRRALSDGGVLMVGPSEVGIVKRSGFFTACPDGPFFLGVNGVP